MLAKEHIGIKKNISDDLPAVCGVTHQLHQIILNLINNSRYALNQKYTGANPNKNIEIYAEQHDVNGEEMVRVVFTDYGIGIPQNMLEKVCNPFFSTKPAGEGTGLGLSISYGIIEEHKGEFHIESKPGQWTRIIIDLPVWREDK